MIRYAYIDKTTFEDELSGDPEGDGGLGSCRIFHNIDDMKEESKCAMSCGIVKVKIELIEIVEKGTNPWSK